MLPIVIDLQSADDQQDAVHRAVQALAEGQLVGFPTETVYGVAASALDEAAVERLCALKQRPANQPMALAIKSSDAALDYVPGLSPVGRRLARRCWPGPVTLVTGNGQDDSVVHQLPGRVREAVVPDGTIGLRVPAHPALLSVLRLSSGPLVLTSANRCGEEPASTGQELARTFGPQVPLVLDGGKCQFGQPSSVVQVTGNRVRILRGGVISALNLKRLSSFVVLLVCTGNTCRSPMAEVLLRHRLAEKLETTTAGLEERGVMVMSAGIAAMSGGRSTPEAVKAVAERGLDLSGHESQPLSDRLVRFADLILTMTRGHREAILAQWPAAADRTHLLCRDQTDVSDPIGGPQEVYTRCAAQIDAQLDAWLGELDLETLIAVMSSEV